MGLSQAPSCTYKLYRPQRKRPKGILKYEFQNDLLPFDFSVLSNVLINSFSFSIFKHKSLLNLLLKYDFQNDLLPSDFLVHSDILVNSSSCGIFNTSNWYVCFQTRHFSVPKVISHSFTPGFFNKGYLSEVVSKTKHSKTKTEARSTQNSKTKYPNLENEAPKARKRSTQNSKTKHPNLENEAPKTRKRSTQNSKTKHPISKTKTPKSREKKHPKLENKALKTRKRRPLNLENENSKPL